MKIRDIIGKYTCGEATLEETNAALKEAGANFHLDPTKNALTIEDIQNGYGLLDTGTGSFDKVQVKDGQLVDCSCGQMKAYVILNGETYEVKGSEVIGL